MKQKLKLTQLSRKQMSDTTGGAGIIIPPVDPCWFDLGLMYDFHECDCSSIYTAFGLAQ